MTGLLSYAEELQALEAAGSLRRIPAIGSKSGSRLTLAGRDLVNLSSNDYLGLGAREDLLKDFWENRVLAAPRPLDFAPGSSGSRLLTGTLACYEELEDALARFCGKPATLLFNTGYHANLGILPALAGPGDAIFCDRLNHASLIDGMKLSGAAFFSVPSWEPGPLGNHVEKA